MRRMISLTLLLLYAANATGCASWHPYTAPVRTLGDAKPSAYYRITLTDGRKVEMTELHVLNDTLWGAVDTAAIVHGENGTRKVARGFPLASVTNAERRTSNAGGTILGVVGAMALFGVLMCGGGKCGPDFSGWTWQ